MINQRHGLPLLTSAASLAGLLFCLWVMRTGGHELCVTEGCSLFQDFKPAGISLWHAGAVFFAAELLLSLARRASAALLLARLALAADCILLCIMAVTAPCVNCLAAGLFIAACCLAARSEAGPPRTPPLLAAAWLCLFLCNAGAVAREAVTPWSPVPADGQPAVRIWFSPSCRACRSIVDSADSLSGAAWYPVPEDDRDIWVIREMASGLAAGKSLPEAVDAAQKAVPPLPDFAEATGYRTAMLRPDMLLLQFRLWRNRAHVLDSGSSRIPLVEFSGVPAFLRDGHGEKTHGTAVGNDVTPDLTVGGFCDGTAEKPCSGAEAPGAIDTSGM